MIWHGTGKLFEPRPNIGEAARFDSGLEVGWNSPLREHPALYTTAQEALASRPAPVRVVGINSGSESMADKVPAHIRISYDLLKELLKLPDDVKVLGIHGIDDEDGCFPLLIETPARHIKRDKLKPRYRSDNSGTHFDGFE